jgi:hypothetical protein
MDECAAVDEHGASLACPGPGRRCINTVGAFTCGCVDGYRPKGCVCVCVCVLGGARHGARVLTALFSHVGPARASRCRRRTPRPRRPHPRASCDLALVFTCIPTHCVCVADLPLHALSTCYTYTGPAHRPHSSQKKEKGKKGWHHASSASAAAGASGCLTSASRTCSNSPLRHSCTAPRSADGMRQPGWPCTCARDHTTAAHLLKLEHGLEVLPLLVDQLHVLFARGIARRLVLVPLGLDLSHPTAQSANADTHTHVSTYMRAPTRTHTHSLSLCVGAVSAVPWPAALARS